MSEMTPRHLLSPLALFLPLFLILGACSGDEERLREPVQEDYISQARSLLEGDQVFDAHAWMGTVSKTLLPEGAPIRYRFDPAGEDRMTLRMDELQIGTMPLTVWFKVDVKFMQLNSWELKEYPGDGWVKFYGDKGSTTYSANAQETEYEDGSGSGGTVTGFLNVKTGMIEMSVNFNVLNFTSEVPLQKIDKTRFSRYAEEKAAYEAALIAYKEAHGL